MVQKSKKISNSIPTMTCDAPLKVATGADQHLLNYSEKENPGVTGSKTHKKKNESPTPYFFIKELILPLGH